MATKRSKKPAADTKASEPERLTIELEQKTKRWKAINQGGRKSRENNASEEPAERQFAEILRPPLPSPLRGILPTPPEVAAAVEDVLAGRPASPSYIQLITDEHKLRYYFGGHWVAYRNTDQGKEVLAVGLEEMSQVRKGMSLAERESVVWASIDLWHNCE